MQPNRVVKYMWGPMQGSLNHKKIERVLKERVGMADGGVEEDRANFCVW